MMKKTGMKLLCILLSALLAFYLFPQSVLAEAFETSVTAEDPETGTDTAQGPVELVSKRRENAKYFKMPDGSYLLAQYADAIHEKKADGTFEEIDNTLKKGLSGYAVSGGRVKFANHTRAAKTVQIKNGDYEISFGLLDAKKSKIETVEKEKNPAGFYSFAELSSYASAVRYPDAYENADVEYLLRGHSLKENIILRRGGQASYIYAFEMKLKGLTPVLSGGAILLCANGETVYEIPAPFMTDAAGADSFAVHYTLSQTKKNTYTVTLTADPDWINASERVFPVTIDPTLYECGVTVQGATIRESAPTQHYSGNEFLFGISESGQEDIFLCKITDFAPLPHNAVIQKAFLSLKVEYISSDSDESISTYASEIAGSWNPATVTYQQYINGQFSISPTLLDVYAAQGPNRFYYNLTSVVQGWYLGTRPNDGVAIYFGADAPTGSIAYIDDYGSYESPFFLINFLDTHGVESHYEYAASSAGAAGSGYVNTFTGELTFLHDVFTTSDAIFPYTFGFSYRSSERNYLSPYYMGAGIRMYTDERILPFDNNSDSLLTLTYTDADGTAHYFTRPNINAPFESEDGLKLTLTQSESGYTLTDDIGNKRIFDATGYLTELQDNNGNRRLFTRDSEKKLTAVSLVPAGTNETIPQLSFTYTAWGYLQTVTNAQTGVTAEFTHEISFEDQEDNMCAVLTGIVYRYPQNSTYTVQYDYINEGQLVQARDTKTGISVYYSYDSMGRVSSYQYKGSGDMAGKITRLHYADRKTTLQSPGLDNLFETTDDLFTVLLFDHTGKVASAYSTDGSLIYGATGYTYGQTNRTQNAPLTVTTATGSDANLLSNPGFDQATEGQTPDRFMAIGSAVSRRIDADELENRQVKLTAPATVNGVHYTTAALSQSFRLPAGTYTLSVWYRWGTNRTNAALRLKILDTNNTVLAESRAAEPQSDNAFNQWERISLTFTVTGTTCLADGYTACFSLEGSTALLSPNAEIYLDSAMLERFSAPGTYSALGNGSFENEAEDWSIVGTGSVITSDSAIFGSKVLRLGTHGTLSSATARTRLTSLWRTQETDSDSGLLSEPTTFLLSGWAKAPAARHYDSQYADMYTSPPKFELRAVIHYAGSTETTTVSVPFSPSVSDWQYAVGAVSTPQVTKVVGNNTFTGYDQVDYVDVYCVYQYNLNEVYFDQISFVKDSNCLIAYTYNEQGYPTGMSDAAGVGESYTYAENGVDMTGIVVANGNSYSAAYDSLHRLTGATGQNGSTDVATTYTYDAFGNVTQSVSVSGNYAMVSSAAYSDTAAYLGAPIRETSADGTITEYIYNSRGQLLCAFLPQQQTGTLYYYNDYGQLIRAVAAVREDGTYIPAGYGNTVYAYNDQGRTASITTATVGYQFEYDAFGDMVRVAVGSRTLSTLSYAAGGGPLISQTYGNGFSLSYTYDSLDRVTGVCYNGVESASFTYTYNAQGQLAVHEDLSNGRVYEYSYDASGRPILTEAVSDSQTVYLCKTEYDALGRVSAVLRYYPQATGSTLSRQSYLYNASGELIRVGYGNTDYTDYTYDSFGRLSVAELKNAYGDRLGAKDTYQYALHGNEGDRQTTSGQLRQLQKTEKVNGQEVTVFYTYTYDYAGNITEIRKTASDGTLLSLSSYLYDKIGQLTRENVKDDETGVSFTQFYTYTNSGNLTARRKYAYSTGTVSGTPLESVSYTYEDSTFKDLLTSVGGESISYDAIGNPTSYRGATLTFQGRRLLSYTKAGTAVSYAYDADGIRTRKTVGNVRHEYETEGGQVYREVIYNGDTLTFDLRYFYDAAGRPAMLQLLTATDSGSMESTVFYYGTNAQGDVIAIYDANGNKIVSYTYDAWGNTLSTQTNGIWGSTVSSLNPFGYRSYYYDSDTGLYYLQSRYYDPQVRRFINADSVMAGLDGGLGYNLFAYCFNNPVNMSDPTGHWPSWATKLVAAAAVVAVVAVVAAVTVATAGAGTAIAAVAVGAAKGAAVGFAIGSATGAAGGAISHRVTTGSWGGAGEDALNGMANGALSGAICGAITGGVKGYSNYSSAVKYLKSNGANAKEVLSAYKNTPKVQTLKVDTPVYRTWGGGTQELGHWVSPNNYGASARSVLSLPSCNTATNTSSFLLPKGTTVLAGEAAPLFGQMGGGIQWWISVLG